MSKQLQKINKNEFSDNPFPFVYLIDKFNALIDYLATEGEECTCKRCSPFKKSEQKKWLDRNMNMIKDNLENTSNMIYDPSYPPVETEKRDTVEMDLVLNAKENGRQEERARVKGIIEKVLQTKLEEYKKDEHFYGYTAIGAYELALSDLLSALDEKN